YLHQIKQHTIMNWDIILAATIPSAIVFATAYFLMRDFMKKHVTLLGEIQQDEQRRLVARLKTENRKIVSPLRLQAYERIVLLLERISPNSLLLRSVESNLTATQMRSKLINSIRTEYEHNLSQQVYISIEAWDSVKNAKEELIKVINTAYGELEKDATANELASKIIEHTVQQGNTPVQNALTTVKKEIQQIF
ncbi:MAG: hypothetical protein R6U19_01930, partial [Bacteroidales bacterium]